MVADVPDGMIGDVEQLGSPVGGDDKGRDVSSRGRVLEGEVAQVEDAEEESEVYLGITLAYLRDEAAVDGGEDCAWRLDHVLAVAGACA